MNGFGEGFLKALSDEIMQGMGRLETSDTYDTFNFRRGRLSGLRFADQLFHDVLQRYSVMEDGDDD